MSTLPERDLHEPPTSLRPVLLGIAAVSLGTYVVLTALALADRSHGRWALALLPLAAVCFAVAGAEAARLLRRR